MKNQALFSSKDKSEKLNCHLLLFLFGSIRVKAPEVKVVHFTYNVVHFTYNVVHFTYNVVHFTYSVVQTRWLIMSCLISIYTVCLCSLILQ